jgi:hypothetical protein
VGALAFFMNPESFDAVDCGGGVSSSLSLLSCFGESCCRFIVPVGVFDFTCDVRNRTGDLDTSCASRMSESVVSLGSSICGCAFMRIRASYGLNNAALGVLGLGFVRLSRVDITKLFWPFGDKESCRSKSGSWLEV